MSDFKCCFWQGDITDVTTADNKALSERKEKQITRQQLLEVQKLQVREKLVKDEGADLKESIQDKVCKTYSSVMIPTSEHMLSKRHDTNFRTYAQLLYCTLKVVA